MHCCHFTKFYIQSLETIPLKIEWMDFWNEIYKNLFFNTEFSQSQLSHPFLKHFHRNNSIYKITTPSYGVKEEICRRMPGNFFSSTQFQRKRKSLVFFQSINFLWSAVSCVWEESLWYTYNRRRHMNINGFPIGCRQIFCPRQPIECFVSKRHYSNVTDRKGWN